MSDWIERVIELNEWLNWIDIELNKGKKVKSAYEPNWLIRPELIPVSVALSD